VIEIEAGYREIEHTADWELSVWAPDLASLLEQAARGMYSLAGTQLIPDKRQARQIDLLSFDPEQLLVAFLSELLWLGEKDGLGFDTFKINLTEDGLHARLEGAPIAAQSKEIKAVTFHNLSIRQRANQYEVNIVFDV
jgi:SHS2 domain-containing protein